MSTPNNHSGHTAWTQQHQRGPRTPAALRLAAVTGEEGRWGPPESRWRTCTPQWVCHEGPAAGGQFREDQYWALSLGTHLERVPQDFTKQLGASSLRGQRTRPSNVGQPSRGHEICPQLHGAQGESSGWVPAALLRRALALGCAG